MNRKLESKIHKKKMNFYLKEEIKNPRFENTLKMSEEQA